MEYVVGSVAALISGNVTPNRPKLFRRALTPTKHQPSPNVTPKSEFVEDRSIFLSPTQQKKKAIIKKSPKRIFQNPDLDTTEDCEISSSLASPKAEKVKKHLKDQLDADNMNKKKSTDLKSPSSVIAKSSDVVSPITKSKIENESNNVITVKKKKSKRNKDSMVNDTSSENIEQQEISLREEESIHRIPKTKMQRRKSIADNVPDINSEVAIVGLSDVHDEQNNSELANYNVEDKSVVQKDENQVNKKKKRKKNRKPVDEINKSQFDTLNTDIKEKNLVQELAPQLDQQIESKKKKNRKKKPKQKEQRNKTVKIKEDMDIDETEKVNVKENSSDSDTEIVKPENVPNPNAITEKDSDSEHESDNEIESDNEASNNQILTNETEQQNPSSDEEEEKEQDTKKNVQKNEDKGTKVMTADEIKRTLFVGNVPFSSKCKKQIKKIFNKYGQIETIRIRTIPVKDARVTPKLAVIKNELHPERTTVNVYVKYTEPSSVGKAIEANNTVLDGHHLRVSRSDTTGAEHDPHCAVFVGNLPFAIEDETLRRKFDKCGEITSVRIIRDKKTNAGKGFGYVNFTSKDGVELALSLSDEDLTIKNRILRVKRCTQGQSKGRRTDGAPWSKGPGGKWNQGRNQVREEGAARRVMNKRKQQEGGADGPANKRQKNITQPNKEKKPRKEFVGTTAEKKKKQKFNKGDKKKKALSEILTKKT